MQDNLVKYFNRTAFLYAGALCLFWFISDQREINLKILNHYRNSARYVTNYAIQSALYDEIKFRESVEYSNRLIQFIPRLEMAYGVLGYSYERLNEYDSAILAYQKAIEHRPELFGFHYNLGLLYYRVGQFEEAKEALSNGLALQPQESIEYQRKVGQRLFNNEQIQQAWIARSTIELKKAYDDSMKLLMSCRKHLANNEKNPDISFFKEQEMGLYYYVPLFETGIIPLSTIVDKNLTF